MSCTQKSSATHSEPLEQVSCSSLARQCSDHGPATLSPTCGISTSREVSRHDCRWPCFICGHKRGMKLYYKYLQAPPQLRCCVYCPVHAKLSSPYLVSSRRILRRLSVLGTLYPAPIPYSSESPKSILQSFHLNHLGLHLYSIFCFGPGGAFPQPW